MKLIMLANVFLVLQPAIVAAVEPYGMEYSLEGRQPGIFVSPEELSPLFPGRKNPKPRPRPVHPADSVPSTPLPVDNDVPKLSQLDADNSLDKQLRPIMTIGEITPSGNIHAVQCRLNSLFENDRKSASKDVE